MNHDRQHARYDFKQELEISHEGRRQPGRSIDISRGGILISTNPTPPFGAKVILHLRLPGVPDVCDIPSVVRWRKSDEEVGLQFEQLRPIEVWALNKLLRGLQ